VCACAVGCIDDTPLLDLNYLEDSSGSPDMPLALLPNSESVTLLQVRTLDGASLGATRLATRALIDGRIPTWQMDSKVPLGKFEEMVELAVEGCRKIHEVMSEHVREHANALITSRGLSAVSS